ncbi:MAG: RtcB family protein [archaeon]
MALTELKELRKNVWQLEKTGEMTVPAVIYADKPIINTLIEEEKSEWSSLRQLKNAAELPGLVERIVGLADIHPGYGAPIGSLIASDLNEGVITFAFSGFDLNCGLNTIKTPLTLKEVEKRKESLAEALFQKIPAGLGVKGKLSLSLQEIDEVIVKGSKFVVDKGFGLKEDLEFTEEKGRMAGAISENISVKAKQRQFKQVGTLGSGNHYLEVQVVEKVFDETTAKAFGLSLGQILVSLHCGSRALGHQTGMDYLKILAEATRKYGVKIKDKELVCAPINSVEGQKYFSAIKGATNTAFANRQVLTHLTREVLSKEMGLSEKEVSLLYGIGHNTAKIEEHEINGKKKKVLIQRKGSTRAFGPGRKELPEAYLNAGQPVLVGGSMGTSSYILAGTELAMKETFGSAIHGAGRAMSRVKANKEWRGSDVITDLKKKGIVIKGHSLKGIAEEAPKAYKPIEEVVNVMDSTGIARKVVEVRPLISIKG